MILGSGEIYGESEIYSLEIDFDELIKELNNDILYYIYLTEGKLSKRFYLWTLYKEESGIFLILDSGITKEGILQFNLNTYGLQYSDTKLKLEIRTKSNGWVLSSNTIFYAFENYLSIDNDEPWYIGKVYDLPDGGSGAVQYVDNHKFPKIKITKLKEDKNNINILIKEIIEEE